MLTYFVVQSFERTRLGFLSPDAPVQATDKDHALRLAGRLAGIKPGVLAFSRTGDPATGEYENAVVIVSHGEVPALDADLSIAC
jgi:hypothetical protein